jgi:hypothetical protein
VGMGLWPFGQSGEYAARVAQGMSLAPLPALRERRE